MSHIDKLQIRQQLQSVFVDDSKVEKIIVFGSFITSDTPHDLDVAVFCNSSDDYLTLALALRKKLRGISSIIPIDLVPIAMPCDPSAQFMQEINKGEVVYEKRH
ncbi:MAG: nucleotidyltransferase domain-containing protein [Trichlorobacter sp.]|uniref:nucleotidyltransferase domain-containing protein n=1 Tax=Trichlorobacter sp. TaxID=2911007 RepID=UPI0025616807|nr:nucleotidyltransferase domain-containing protein [Trichlorobacter sp.]MDK9718812.1 nucleotidyltransferase domain-containing protein [Trichlorobacter sp.]